eukprot:5212892-Amphidinium_carterae.1
MSKNNHFAKTHSNTSFWKPPERAIPATLLLHHPLLLRVPGNNPSGSIKGSQTGSDHHEHLTGN